MTEPSDFGHLSASWTWHGMPLHIDGWGTGPFVIEAGGKTFRFEDSARFGPNLVKANGELASSDLPGARSPFWQAHLAWIRQGRKLADDGVTCIYRPFKPTKVRHVGGNNYVVVEYGDDDYDGGTEIVP